MSTLARIEQIDNSKCPTMHEIQAFTVMAKQLHESGFYKKSFSSESQILAVMLMGKELGIPPMLAVNKGIHLIQGSPEISARLMTGLIRRAGHSIEIVESTNFRCELVGKRGDNGDTMKCEFSMDDAKAAGLTGVNWQKYPSDMLFARALTRLSRRLFADVIGTAYIEGEISDPAGKKLPPPDIEEMDFQVIENMKETPEKIEEMLKEYHSGLEDVEFDLMKEFFTKWTTHYSKTFKEALNRYNDKNLFVENFKKWIAVQKK